MNGDGIATCPFVNCPNPPEFLQGIDCDECIDGYQPNDDGSECEVCCPPLNGTQEILQTCGFEGCECCPDGTWSGSIGDGKTFCGGLVLGVDEFGSVCGATTTTTTTTTDR